MHKTHKKMLQISASGKKISDLDHTLAAEKFLKQYGDTLTPEFKTIVSERGINLGRTSIEADYVYIGPEGKVRVGIPYRAMSFTAL